MDSKMTGKDIPSNILNASLMNAGEDKLKDLHEVVSLAISS